MKSEWKNEPRLVLDACALIAFLNDEPGAEVVAAIPKEVPSVEMSAVNLVEIAYDAIRETGDLHTGAELLETVRQLPIKIHWHINDETFQQAARFKASCRISLADAFALASRTLWTHQWQPVTTTNSISSRPTELHASSGSANTVGGLQLAAPPSSAHQFHPHSKTCPSSRPPKLHAKVEAFLAFVAFQAFVASAK